MTPSRAMLSRLAALRPAKTATSDAPRAPREDDALGRLLGATVNVNHYGEHLAVRRWFPTPEFCAPDAQALDLLAQDRDAALGRRARAALEDPEKWLFLDTETTGLSGGTGTYAFLVGVAWWDAGGVQTEQFVMRDFTEEYSMLHEVAQRIAERPVLVTFNGKCFDWPLLESRFTMTRAIAKPRLAAHLDLLHPARALWKFRIGSVRLAELERRVLDPARLGWDREDDVISSMIPQLYFDYLRGGAPDPIAGVVRHNQMDLRGLAALFGKVNSMLAAQTPEVRAEESVDLFGLSRFLERRGEQERAQSACAQALEIGLPGEYRGAARRALALHAKREGRYDRAEALWLELANDPRTATEACEQLAIHYEHRKRDVARAAEFAGRALANLQRRALLARNPADVARFTRHEARLVRRIERLKKRLQAHRESDSDRNSQAERLLLLGDLREHKPAEPRPARASAKKRRPVARWEARG
jgi:uncharacterized protein YprB with RNaseH-like and TPR domain